MASKPKASGAGVYNKRISGTGQGAVITRSNGETVKQATDEEAQLRVGGATPLVLCFFSGNESSKPGALILNREVHCW